jgi:hypothetical protein
MRQFVEKADAMMLICAVALAAIVVSDTLAGMAARATFVAPLALAGVIDTNTLIVWASWSLF